MEKRFPDYKAPETSTARVFKDKDRGFDDLPLTGIAAENAKKYMEMQIGRRRAGEFTPQVINLGGFHHVMDPGPDIGLTPALPRPDLAKGHPILPCQERGDLKPILNWQEV